MSISVKYYLSVRKINLLTVLFSCDRNSLLNLTISSFYKHLQEYEASIISNFHFVDSGTLGRLYYVRRYGIMNIFFMNPNNPEYSYGMFWSYMHGKYVLFLEDDRPFKNRIEQFIYYPNYIEEAILLLGKIEKVKGILLKEYTSKTIKVVNIKTLLGNHLLNIIMDPPNGFSLLMDLPYIKLMT